MTVCIAAISNNGMIITASDRMLSTDEIAFEPESEKAWIVTSAIYALWSGDAAVQAEILGAVRRDVQALLAQTPPPDWFPVGEVVDLYVAHWNATKRRRATAALLAPLGLTMETFLQQQQIMDAAMVDRLTNAVVNYFVPHTSCIIAGIDREGPHIWTIQGGVATCADTLGFATIGAGARHADSQMMLGRHSAKKTPSETAVLVHLAKKRAEVSPSVGEATDMHLIGPTLGQQGTLADSHLAQLDEAYDALVAQERFAFASAEVQFDAYLAAIDDVEPSPQDAEEGDDQDEGGLTEDEGDDTTGS